MRKSRLILTFSILIVLFCFFIFASPIFHFSSIEVVFLKSDNENLLNLSQSKSIDVITIKTKTEALVKDDYGKSIFLIKKDKYSKAFEFNNPKAKLENIQIVFPNKVVFSVSERQPVFFISFNSNQAFVLDKCYKILSIQPKTSVKNLIEITTFKNNSKIDFFNFFEISTNAFSLGLFLAETNIILHSIYTLVDDINTSSGNVNLMNIISEISICEENEGKINLKILTEGECGVSLVIENVMTKFSQKMKKITNAFNSLYNKEKIKTTYGTLKINNSLNCSWNKL